MQRLISSYAKWRPWGVHKGAKPKNVRKIVFVSGPKWRTKEKKNPRAVFCVSSHGLSSVERSREFFLMDVFNYGRISKRCVQILK